MAAVYSVCFIASFAGAVEADYTVPTGRTAIVRDIDGFLTGTPGSTAVDFVDGTSGSVIWFHTQVGNTESVSWRGRQVFEAGSVIRVSRTSDLAASIRVSGYLLSD